MGVRTHAVDANQRLFRDLLGMEEVAVSDIVVAQVELETAGVETIGDTVWASDLTGSPDDAGWGWFFFRAPDGTVYVIQQDGSAIDA